MFRHVAAVAAFFAEFVAILHAIHAVLDGVLATFPAGLHPVVDPDDAVSEPDWTGDGKAEPGNQANGCADLGDVFHLEYCLPGD